MTILRRDEHGVAAQAFVLQKGYIMLTSGTIEFPLGIHCYAAGTITITWKNNTTTQMPLSEGDEFFFDSNAKSVTIDPTSGTFHVMTYK